MEQPDNLIDGKRVPIMHGENWLQPVEQMPAGNLVECTTYIAGHSETGHHHIINSPKPMQVLETDTERYVLISEVSKLYHQKTTDIHETKHLAPGAYRITHKTEYDPFQKVVRRVYD